jgi:transcriptional regulator with XRE-family HTH domain
MQRVQALTPETIRAARRAVGMSQRELAGRLGYTAPWLNNIEHGKRSLPWREAPRLVEVLLAAHAARQEVHESLAELGLAHLPVALCKETAP